jgi:hypothetical protein
MSIVSEQKVIADIKPRHTVTFHFDPEIINENFFSTFHYIPTPPTTLIPEKVDVEKEKMSFLEKMCCQPL